MAPAQHMSSVQADQSYLSSLTGCTAKRRNYNFFQLIPTLHFSPLSSVPGDAIETIKIWKDLSEPWRESANRQIWAVNLTLPRTKSSQPPLWRKVWPAITRLTFDGLPDWREDKPQELNIGNHRWGHNYSSSLIQKWQINREVRSVRYISEESCDI